MATSFQLKLTPAFVNWFFQLWDQNPRGVVFDFNFIRFKLSINLKEPVKSEKAGHTDGEEGMKLFA